MTIRPLSGTHILVIDDDQAVRKDLREALEGLGAAVHEASGRTEALGKIVEMSTKDQCPRAIVTDWVLNPPDSKEHRFYRLLGRNASNTSLSLIRNIRRIDRTIPIIVWSYWNESLPADVVKVFGLQPVDKHCHGSLETVLHLLRKDETIQDRRHRSGELDLSDSDQLRMAQGSRAEQDQVVHTATEYLNRPDVARAMSESMTPTDGLPTLRMGRRLSRPA